MQQFLPPSDGSSRFWVSISDQAGPGEQQEAPGIEYAVDWPYVRPLHATAVSRRVVFDLGTVSDQCHFSSTEVEISIAGVDIWF
jgi:hypothetical protein